MMISCGICIGSGITISICNVIGCVIRIVIGIAISISAGGGIVWSTIYSWTEMRLTEGVSLMMIGFI